MYRTVRTMRVLLALSALSALALGAPAAQACGWWGEGEDYTDDAIIIRPSDALQALNLTPTDPAGMAELSTAYRLGNRLAQSDILAFEWAGKAAEAGHAGAMNDFAQMNEIGFLGQIDNGVAVHWYEKAAALGVAAAQHSLASMLRDGNGRDQDITAANLWLKRAANQGHDSATAELATRIWADTIAPEFPEEGCFWWLAAIRQGLDVSPQRCRQMRPDLSDTGYQALQARVDAWQPVSESINNQADNGDS